RITDLTEMAVFGWPRKNRGGRQWKAGFERRNTMRHVCTSITLVTLFACSPIVARADVVLDWNAIAVSTLVSQGQSPFAQARFMAIIQLAVFEAVNAITGNYKPYLGTVVAPAGASSDAAA